MMSDDTRIRPAARTAGGPTRGTRAAYAMGELGATLPYATLNTWLLYYLVNIAGIGGLLAGSAFVVGRVVDALLDPVIGHLSDRKRDRWRRIGWIRVWLLPLAVSFAVLFAAPLAAPADAEPLRWLLAVAALLVFSFTYTAVVIPYLALTPSLAASYDDRTTLTGWRMGMSIIASLLAFALPPILVAAVTGVDELAATPASGWIVMGCVLAVVGLVGLLVTATRVREPAPLGTVATTGFSITAAATAFRVREFRAAFTLYLVITLALMTGNALLPFALESVLNLGAGDITTVLAVVFLSAILFVPVWSRAAMRVGKGRALAAGMAAEALALLLLMGLRPGVDEPAVLWPVVLLAGFGLSAVIVLPWAIVPDAVEFDELAHGERREGLLYAIVTFGQKLAGSVAIFSTAIVAVVFGYQEGQASQSPATVDGLAFGLGPLVAGIYVVGIVLALRLPIDRAGHARVRAELDARSPQPTGVRPPTGPGRP